MSKFFVKTEQIKNNNIIINGDDVNHIINVLRMKKGDELQICNQETGDNYNAQITQYTKDEVDCEIIEKINKIRKIRPDISITTDVIVGFPNETDKNFNETIETIKKVDFSKLHVFPYSKREGTKAATMEGQVKEEIKKQRVMELLKLSKELENKYMNKFIGKTLTFIPEVYKDGYLIGHTGNYLLIKLKGCEELLHKEVSVKLMENQYPYIISSAI